MFPEDVSPEEWQARVDLAACYHICSQLGYNESIVNHLTAMVPGTTDHFLVNAFGLMWEEVTAANLLTVRTFYNNSKLGMGYEVVRGKGDALETSIFIHGAVHMGLGEKIAAACFHTHMPYATALCCTEDCALPMLHQACLRFHGSITSDRTYNGVVLNGNEAKRLCEMMGENRVILHSNHGPIVNGASIAGAMDDLYYLEKSAEICVKAMSTGRPVVPIREEVCIPEGDRLRMLHKVAANDDGSNEASHRRVPLHFYAWKRKLDRQGVDYIGISPKN